LKEVEKEREKKESEKKKTKIVNSTKNKNKVQRVSIKNLQYYLPMLDELVNNLYQVHSFELLE